MTMCIKHNRLSGGCGVYELSTHASVAKPIGGYTKGMIHNNNGMFSRITFAFKNPLALGIVPTIAIALSFGLSYAYAGTWTPPGQNPPAGNVDAPINVGGVGQTKYITPGSGGGLSVSEGYIQAYAAGGATSNGLLSYASYGGYFYGVGGVYSQNAQGAITYLDYPGTNWGVYTNSPIYTASYARADGGMRSTQYCDVNGANCITPGSSSSSCVTQTASVNVPVPGSSVGSVSGTASCSAGYHLTGGGCNPGMNNPGVNYKSYPSGNGWYCVQTPDPHVGTVYAICCN